MKNPKRQILPGVLVITAIILIAVCFCLSIVIVERYAKEECFDNIEEAAVQASDMFGRALKQSQNQLDLFANILASNGENPEELLRSYMENFCSTQHFAALCLHWADGTSFSYGVHPHDAVGMVSFEEELGKLPYVSEPYKAGELRSEQYICIAVPVERERKTAAVLYGYLSLDVFPSLISSSAYGGNCCFYIVNGDTGDFLMDEYHRTDGISQEELPLSNAFSGMEDREAMPGYSLESMRQGMREGGSGYFVFESQRTGERYYTYFMPMDINNWSMQITIDEPTALAAYYDVCNAAFSLMIAVVLLCLLMLAVLTMQSRKRLHQEKLRLEKERKSLHKSEYVSGIQAALISAHNNPDFVAQALKLTAREMQAETALLLLISDKMVSDVYFWPSEDRLQAKALLGRDIQVEFPTLFDALAANESVFCGPDEIGRFSAPTKALFEAFDIRNLLMAPVADNAGICKGAIVTVNMTGLEKSAEMLMCVTRDFYMAITNLESHNIIKRMGAIDYMTGVKNRNSYETETAEYETLQADSLWSVYVDVNGLHELNNSQGHKAGDSMLCSVAEAMKKLFGADHTYRMGGDEFVAFRINSSHEEMMSLKHRLIDAMERKGYSVSVGFEGAGKNENNVFDVEQITAAAESIMYREKWKCYERNHISTERKYLPPRIPES